jgi:NAD(P)-dependent dehydrogenase (short-subunit alcohol dehydrogenase family)
MTAQVWFITGSPRGLGRSVAEEALDLVLGRDAVDHMASVIRDTAAEDTRRAHAGRSVDFG